MNIDEKILLNFLKKIRKNRMKKLKKNNPNFTIAMKIFWSRFLPEGQKAWGKSLD